LVYGYVSLVEGMIARIQKEMNADAKVIATGEQLALIAKETRALDVVDEYLTLHGLRFIYELNTIAKIQTSKLKIRNP
jgi:type III pantothenate kinase